MKISRKLMAGVLSAALLLTVIPDVRAESSADLRSEINDLSVEYSIIQSQLDDLQVEMDANWESIEEMVAYKNNVDQQMFLLYSEIDNLDRQITNYSTLIVETQQKLDQAQADLDELNQKYKDRIRAMEEEGELSYWSVIFKASSFTDLVDRINMVREIAAADQRMLERLEAATTEVAQTKEQLEGEKAGLEESRQALLDSQAELETLRAEADRVLAELNANRQELEAMEAEYDREKSEYAAAIAQAEKELNEALAREEEERRQHELNNSNNSSNNSGSNDGDNGGDEESDETTPPDDDDDDDDDEPANPPSTDSGWLQPCSYIYISSSYGYRSSGWHNGVDFAGNRGTPIYASRSGTVTKAVSMTTSYGNHVVINHGDGYSSLYAHMDYYVVSAGEYVSQGQLIGYMGSTGNSSGNHLHFTIFYNGSDVNPMNYL